MPTIMTDLWPEDIRVDVLSPLVVLKVQAGAIKERTKGVLEGQVTSVTGDQDLVTHRLEIIPVQLDRARHRILAATHKAQIYPAVIEAEVFKPKPPLYSPSEVDLGPLQDSPSRARLRQQSHMTGSPDSSPRPWPDPSDWRPVASSQEEFIERVKTVLRSPQVRAVIDSLLARSYEKVNAAAEEAVMDSATV